ncbi:MAG: FMN-binding protein [Bacillota bacterium]
MAGCAALAFLLLAAFLWMRATREPPYAGYPDGTYIGEATGYRKHLKAQVTLKDGYITAVEIIEHYEKGADRYAEPMEKIPQAIIRKQSPDVDVVVGSTLTSNGIMDAVRAALEQAKPR